MRPSENRMLIELLAARWLGHGRAIECYLALAAGLEGLLLLTVPGAALDSSAMADLDGGVTVLGSLLLAKAVLTGSGLYLNIQGSLRARPLRMAGAFLGGLVWMWLTGKFISLRAFAALGFPFCLFAAVFSIRILGLAWADLPRPGAPGVRA